MMKSTVSVPILLVIILLTRLSEARLTHELLSDRVVTTNFGKLRGVRVEFSEDNLQQVEAYLGVQYASLRGGDLRFMPPTNPNEKWEGVKIANTFKPVCPQKMLDYDSLPAEMPAARAEHLRRIGEFTTTQAEDCLYLNIYVPARERTGPAPVVVFIHGDSYDFGTGNAYDGSVLSSHADVVVVTLNYRLGPLGFLSTMDASASGNFALFDLVAALHWIQTNIADFGGDRSRVTIMGHGYGAALSHLLSLSPVTARMNLFSRIILLSGSALSPWAMAKNPRDSSFDLASALNCMPEVKEDEELNTRQLIKCLKNVSFAQMMNTAIDYDKYTTAFGPVVDQMKILLDGTPESLIKRTDTLYSEIELMFGLTKYEGSTLLSDNQLNNGISNLERVRIMREYVKSQYKHNRQKIVDTFDHQYYSDNRNDSSLFIHKTVEFLGDGEYNVPSISSGLSHIQRDKDTYFYVFSHSARDSPHTNYQNGHHGEELPFLFGAPLTDKITPYADDIKYSKQERILSEAVMRFFGNFIKSGNPNIPLMEGSPAELTIDTLRFLDVYWPRYDQETQKYLQFGTRPLVNHHYRGKRVSLWTELIPKLHRREGSSPEADREFTVEPVPGSVTSNASRGFRHVIPQPPTPPMMPPFRENSSVYTNQGLPKPVSDAAGSTERDEERPDVRIDPKPVDPQIEIVTKIVEVRRYVNKTRVITKTVPIKQEQEQDEKKGGVTMNLTLSITIGVGCALLFLNLIILLGVYCQRDKLKTERKAIEKLTQPTMGPSETTPLKVDRPVEHKEPQLHGTDKVINMLDNHLYDKAVENHDKKNMERSNNGSVASHDRYTDRNTDLNHVEQGQGRNSLSHRQQNQYVSHQRPNPQHQQHPQHVQHAQQQQYRDEYDSDIPVIKGVPQEPARAPPPRSDSNNGFDVCRNYGRTNSSSSRRGSEGSMGGRRETPVPRQRTQDSMSRMSDNEEGSADHRLRSPRTPRDSLQRSPRTPRVQRANRQDSYHSNDEYNEQCNSMNRPRGGGGRGRQGHLGVNGDVPSHYYNDNVSPRRQAASPRRLEESPYQTPRRLNKYGEDAGSSDSGVQHMTYISH